MEFGELFEPETRAFWSNYDEFENEYVEIVGESTCLLKCSIFRCRNAEPVVLSWKWMDEEAKDKSVVEPFNNFYIFEGRQLSDFINQTVLKNLSPLCQLESFKTSVYRLPGGKNVVCLSEGNDIDRTAQITELLAPWLNAASQVTAFSFQAAYSYNTTKDFDKRCFVRSICSSQSDASYSDLPFVKPMEDCNMIYGVCAGGKSFFCSDFPRKMHQMTTFHLSAVSTWRYRGKLPFRCYAIYIDCPAVDSVVAKPILQLFRKCDLTTTSSYVFKNINNSNLYI